MIPAVMSESAPNMKNQNTIVSNSGPSQQIHNGEPVTQRGKQLLILTTRGWTEGHAFQTAVPVDAIKLNPTFQQKQFEVHFKTLSLNLQNRIKTHPENQLLASTSLQWGNKRDSNRLRNYHTHTQMVYVCILYTPKNTHTHIYLHICVFQTAESHWHFIIFD